MRSAGTARGKLCVYSAGTAAERDVRSAGTPRRPLVRSVGGAAGSRAAYWILQSPIVGSASAAMVWILLPSGR